MVDAIDLIDELKDKYIRAGIEAGRDAALSLYWCSDMLPADCSFNEALESLDVDYLTRHTIEKLDEHDSS